MTNDSQQSAPSPNPVEIVSETVIQPGDSTPVAPVSNDPVGDKAISDFKAFEDAARAAEEAGHPDLFKAPDKVESKPADAPPPAAEQKPADAPKPKLSAAERIAQLTRQKGDKERELEAANTRLREQEERIAALERGERPAAATSDEPVAPTPNDKNPDGSEKYAFGELDSAYIRDLARHEALQTVREDRTRGEKARQEQAAREAAEALDNQWADQLEAATAQHPDFVEKVFRGGEAKAYALNRETFEMAQESEFGAQVLYHLASNPKEALALYKIADPVERARSFGRLEARFESGAQPVPPANPTPRTPKADPPAPQARGTNGQFEGTPTDFKSFEAKFQPILDKQR